MVGVGLDFNSIAGLGELVYLRANGHSDGGDNGFFETYPRNRTLAGGFVVPTWVDGLTFNAEFTDARTTPLVTEAGVPPETDTFQRLSLRLRYAWLRGRNANFNSELAFDAQEERLSLFPGPDLVPFQVDRLPHANGRLKVGIVWSGSITFGKNHRRAQRLLSFFQACALPGVQLYSLQKGPPVKELTSLPRGGPIIDLDPHLADFSDTAAAVANLDLVIMTDSAVAHLAGALGKPVWVLIRSQRSLALAARSRGLSLVSIDAAVSAAR